MFNQKSYEKISKLLIFIGLSIIVISTFLFALHREYGASIPIDNELFSHYGGFVGGVVGTLFSLVGVLLLIETLRLQRTHFIQQQEKNLISFEKQQIETRFFELVKISRENSEQAYTKGYTGRRAIAELNKEFKSLFSEIKDWGEIEKFNVAEKEWKALLINITYLIFFIGVDESNREFLNEHLSGLFKNDAMWKEFETELLCKLKEEHKNIKDKNKEIPRNDRKYLPYDGHQNVLGHYFRHLYQTVKYINSQIHLSYKEKYEYIKTLRAQLSTIEQLLFFYNSLSTFGSPWELSEKITDPNQKLITKYNLVKNLTSIILEVTHANEFYPDVTFEGQEKSKNRTLIENDYS